LDERIILLNGTSSSGKTTIARSLQRVLDPRWLFLGFDEFVQMLTDEAPDSPRGPTGDEFGRWLAEVWYRAVGGLAAAGFDLIVEDVILRSYRLDAAIQLLAPFDVTFVAVRCPLDVALERERARGDRSIGLVAHQFDRVHADRTYDCEIDTSTSDAGACVAAIQKVMEEGGVRAFDVMAQ
jgi:chloramphenicol 3-O phosphotransferase